MMYYNYNGYYLQMPRLLSGGHPRVLGEEVEPVRKLDWEKEVDWKADIKTLSLRTKQAMVHLVIHHVCAAIHII